MTPRTARDVLGLAEGASSAEIEDAYRRMMRRAHPIMAVPPGWRLRSTLRGIASCGVRRDQAGPPTAQLTP